MKLIVFWLLVSLVEGGVTSLVAMRWATLLSLSKDRTNSLDASTMCNKMILAEFAGQLVLTVVSLLFGHWILFLANLPMTVYNVYTYMHKQHLIDQTTIATRTVLDKEMRQSMYRMGFLVAQFVVLFFLLVRDGLLFYILHPERTLALVKFLLPWMD